MGDGGAGPAASRPDDPGDTPRRAPDPADVEGVLTSWVDLLVAEGLLAGRPVDPPPDR